jgi:hypothetical protein
MISFALLVILDGAGAGAGGADYSSTVAPVAVTPAKVARILIAVPGVVLSC